MTDALAALRRDFLPDDLAPLLKASRFRRQRGRTGPADAG